MADPGLMLVRGKGKMDKEGWQVASGLSMWWNMQKSERPLLFSIGIVRVVN
jgi:hypothetical protein